MRHLISLTTVLSVIILFSAAALADFSADTVTTSPHGTVKGKIYSTSQDGYNSKKTRTETSAEGHTSIMIIDQDKKVLYMLMPEQKMYMKQTYNPNGAKEQKATVDKPISKTFVRNDKFDGHPVKVYNAKTDEGGDIVIWEATDINNFPVKIEMPSEKATMEYHNVSTKPVNKSLFEVPSDYSAISMPTGM